MKKEFNLSEERHDIDLFGDEFFYYKEIDIKEAVKRLKEEIKDTDYTLDYLKEDEWELIIDELKMLIDKIFGDKLI